ncbi:hypothetical protein [Limimaricola soesokkakensis]|uniref:hypothetical protein n=1 Tax=Limimaricola soesokkakensis TaxID=1343159 RepID=UPI00351423C5
MVCSPGRAGSRPDSSSIIASIISTLAARGLVFHSIRSDMKRALIRSASSRVIVPWWLAMPT